MLEGYKEYKKTLSHFDRIIPKHWIEQRLLVVCKPKSIINNYNEELLSVFLNYGVIKYKSTSQKQVHKPSEDLSKYQLVEIGDLVLNNQQAWRGSVGVSSYRGIVSPAYYVYKISPEYNSSFFNYMVRDRDVVDQFVLFSKGVGSIQRMLNNSLIKNVIFTLPPRPEQDQIVRYLDWKVSMINKYINAKKKQIELLKEHKQAVINEAVTRDGEAWKKLPLTSISKQKSIVNCINRELLSVYLGIGVVPFSSRDEKRTNATSKDLSKYQAVDFGDFVLNNQQAWRGSVGVSKYSGIVSPAYIVLQLDNTLTTEYANYLFQSRNMVNKYVLCSKGIGSIQRNIDWDYLKKIDIEFPPVAEQHSIVKYLNEKCEYIDKFAKKLNDEIMLFSEYRTRLISDVVTGKVNVQNVKVPEFENIEVPDVFDSGESEEEKTNGDN